MLIFPQANDQPAHLRLRVWLTGGRKGWEKQQQLREGCWGAERGVGSSLCLKGGCHLGSRKVREGHVLRRLYCRRHSHRQARTSPAHFIKRANVSTTAAAHVFQYFPDRGEHGAQPPLIELPHVFALEREHRLAPLLRKREGATEKQGNRKLGT